MKKLLLLIVFMSSTGVRLLHAQSTNPAPYCDASFDDAQGFLVDDHINSVSFGTLSNTTNSQFAAPHYVFYNNLSIPAFVPGNTYTLTVNFTTAGGCGYGVWIDYNHNNAFENAEKVAGTTGNTFLAVGTNPSITQSVTIPSSAVTGNTRMRIRIVEDDMYHINTTSELPCNASSSATDVMDWGETEDYTINIVSTVGMQEAQTNPSISLLQNPVYQTINLHFNGNADYTYRILNLAGQQVQCGLLTPGAKEIVVSELPEGFYLIQVFQSNRLAGQQKFVKLTQ